MPHLISYALRRREAIGPGIIRIMKTVAEDARKAAEQPESALEKSIHDLRTLIKRLRAYLWFVRPLLGNIRYRRANAALRKAAARLGHARDVVAVQSALTRVAISDAHEDHLQALTRVSQALARKESERQEADGDSRSPLRKVAVVIVEAIEEMTTALEKTSRPWPSSQRRMKKALHAAQTAKKAAQRENKLPLFHEWRKKSKRLFYLLQLTARRPELDVTDALEKADKLQEALGHFQDGVVAEQHLRRHSFDIDALDRERTMHLLKKKRKLLLNDARLCWRAMIRELES